jgi:tryptophan-rich sensory protein
MENNDSWISIAVIVLVFAVIGLRLIQRMKKYRQEKKPKKPQNTYKPYEDDPGTNQQEE